MHHLKTTFLFIAVLVAFPLSAKQTIIINDIYWPPYFFTGDKQQQGIGKELINICLSQAGYNTEYHRLPVKRTHLYMENGDIDITIYSYRKSREKFVWYGKESLFNTNYGFMVRANSDINITKLADLTPYKMGHLAGLSYSPELMEIIESKAKSKQLTTGYNLVAMFSQLLAPTPRFDIMADAKTTLYWQAQKLGLSDKIKVLDYTINKKNYFITVSKKSKNITDPQAFLKETDQCIKSLKNDGRYQAILSTYGYKNSHK